MITFGIGIFETEKVTPRNGNPAYHRTKITTLYPRTSVIEKVKLSLPPSSKDQNPTGSNLFFGEWREGVYEGKPWRHFKVYGVRSLPVVESEKAWAAVVKALAAVGLDIVSPS